VCECVCVLVCWCASVCACERARAYTPLWVSLRTRHHLRIVDQLIINKLAETTLPAVLFGLYLRPKYFVRVRC
jgi:hypothetical protein